MGKKSKKSDYNKETTEIFKHIKKLFLGSFLDRELDSHFNIFTGYSKKLLEKFDIHIINRPENLQNGDYLFFPNRVGVRQPATKIWIKVDPYQQYLIGYNKHHYINNDHLIALPPHKPIMKCESLTPTILDNSVVNMIERQWAVKKIENKAILNGIRIKKHISFHNLIQRFKLKKNITEKHQIKRAFKIILNYFKSLLDLPHKNMLELLFGDTLNTLNKMRCLLFHSDISDLISNHQGYDPDNFKNVITVQILEKYKIYPSVIIIANERPNYELLELNDLNLSNILSQWIDWIKSNFNIKIPKRKLKFH